MTQPILVVGAGPVGLTAALSLVQQGVTSRLIDQLPERVNQSRAAGIQARTLEMFERLGVSAGEWRKALVRHEPHPRLFDCWDFGKGPHPGERAPDAQGLEDGARVPRRLHQDWTGDHRHQLLVFTGRHPMPPRVRQLAELGAQVQAESGGLIRSRLIRVAEVPGTGGELMDHDGEAHHLYGARYECLYLVRPDGYVGFRSQPAEKEALQEYLGQIFLGTDKASIPLRAAA